MHTRVDNIIMNSCNVVILSEIHTLDNLNTL